MTKIFTGNHREYRKHEKDLVNNIMSKIKNEIKIEEER